MKLVVLPWAHHPAHVSEAQAVPEDCDGYAILDSFSTYSPLVGHVYHAKWATIEVEHIHLLCHASTCCATVELSWMRNTVKAPVRTTLQNGNVISAYPDGPVKVVDFKYVSDLHLFRRIEAVQSRRGKDASYIVSQDYKAYATMKAVDSDKGEEFPIWVPRCLLTDLASIPWFRRLFVDRVGPHLEACIIHDWLYVA